MDNNIESTRGCVQPNSDASISQVWRDEEYPLTFTLGGLEWQSRIPARILTTPWSQLSLKPILPPWEETPKDIPLVVVPAQPVREALPVFSLTSGCFRYVVSQENRYLLKFEGSFDQYMMKFGAKQRYNFRRAVHRLTEFCGGELRDAEYRSLAELRQFRGAAMEISRKSPLYLQGAGLPKSESGWKAVFESVPRGDSCVRMLFHGPRPIAYFISLGRREHNTLLLWKVGYDPEYAPWSPGTVLLLNVIERLFIEGRFSLLDFGPMEFDYKRWFGTHHPLPPKFLLRPSLKSAGLVALNIGINRGAELMGAMLNELGVKQQFKTVMRFARRHGIRRSK